MESHQLFLNEAGRLRSGWRLGIFTVVYVALLFGVSSLVRLGYLLAANLSNSARLGSYLADILFRLVLLAPALLAGWICTRFVEGLPWRALGLSPHSGWLRDLLFGSLVGAASLVLATAIATAAGGLHFTLSGRQILPQVGRTLVSSALLFVVAATAEESLFRGYPLQTTSRAGLAWLGVLLTSIPFAGVHLRNPNVVQGFTFINTALAGIWLAVAYLRTRSLWFPIGVHWAWNWALGAVFGLPVSGITGLASYPLMQGIDRGPAWLTGGSYGIEGGLACTITLFMSTLYIWRTRLLKATHDMKAFTSAENPTARSPKQLD